VLFECLAGQPPFVNRNEAVVLQQHLTQPAPDLRTLQPEVPEVIAGTIARALAKTPAERWASASAMLDALTPAMVG
jgi:serine/threonine-protein kinase